MEQQQLIREFEARSSRHKQLEEEALFILKQQLSATQIKYHSVTSRIKELDSFLKKTQRKELDNPLDQIQDIVGLRIVCLFLSDIGRIGNLIRESFSVLSEDNKVEGTDVSSFGYMSVHFIATMKETYVGPRYDSVAKLPFEIQVRTIAMDAWANVSHHLDYKSEEDVPTDLKRDFYALSGLFYVADKHFEMFYGASSQSKEQMSELFAEASPNVKADQEINLDSLTAYLNTKFPDRNHMDSSWVSSLLRDLKQAGYKTIGDIEKMVENTVNAFNQYEHDKFKRTFLADVGVVRISGEIANDEMIRAGLERSFLGGDLEKSVNSNIKYYERYRKMLKHPPQESTK